MEGNRSSGNMMPGDPYLLDLQGSMEMNHQQQPHASFNHHNQQQDQNHHAGSMLHQQMHDVSPLRAGLMHDRNQHLALPIMDCNKVEHGKTPTSEEDDLSFSTEDGVDVHNEAGKGKKASPWQRVKWTEGMVKLLITAVSYIGEDVASDSNIDGKRKSVIVQKKGKWKSISKVMDERGFHVSPQQCEDKFNDLNKRYKRLNDILGRGTSCKVVENPSLLDMMDHLSDKVKNDVKKILNSKHLFYEEMCSYHNGNRLHLPADPVLQRSLQLALSSRDENDARRAAQDDIGEDDRGTYTDDKEDDVEENSTLHRGFGGLSSQKRLKEWAGNDDVGLGSGLASQDFNRRLHSQGITFDENRVFPEGPKAAWAQQQWMRSRSLQLEGQRLQIQEQMLELEKERFTWQQFSKIKDRELNKMRMENEMMKLENERWALELKRKELESKSK